MLPTLSVLNLNGAVPQIAVAGAGMLIMLIDALFHRGSRRWAAYLALLGLAVALARVVESGASAETILDGALARDGLGMAFALVLIVAAALSVLVAMDYLRREEHERAEYYALILFATAGGLAMAMANDLVAVFIGLETLSISLYVLSAFFTGDAASREAALKYLLLGAFASAFFLYGIALLYGASGTTRLVEMGTAIRLAGTQADPLLWGGVALIIVGVGFKLALVPFHSWAPDVYQGAPTSVTAFMSVASKVAAFAALVRLLVVVLAPAAPLTSALLALLAVLTMTVGNILALAQDEVKRLLAYSSIAQAGYILVAAVAGEVGAAAVLFYLLGYAFTNLGAFAVVLAWSRRGEGRLPFSDLAGLGFRRPWTAAALSLFLLSLTGMPLTVGFVGKLYLFGAAVQAGWTWLAIVAVLNSVVSAFYYLRLVVIMYMREAEMPLALQRAGLALGVALAVCAAGVILLGLVPGVALDWARQAVAVVLS